MSRRGDASVRFRWWNLYVEEITRAVFTSAGSGDGSPPSLWRADALAASQDPPRGFQETPGVSAYPGPRVTGSHGADATQGLPGTMAAFPDPDQHYPEAFQQLLTSAVQTVPLGRAGQLKEVGYLAGLPRLSGGRLRDRADLGN